tara:strand:- start:643 stop:783 length:141 start_codon:yes stop_codon:yes gene_type:complete
MFREKAININSEPAIQALMNIENLAAKKFDYPKGLIYPYCSKLKKF